ncbi:LysR substrate-binding domain-containing protein [Escherichia coli]
MPAVISRFHQQHPQVKVRIMEGQLVSMINELRQGELDFTINTYYQDRTTTNLLLRNYWKSNSRSLPPGTPRHWCPFDQLLDYSWTMPTPHGSYYKQLSELLDNQAQTPQVGVVCEKTLSACLSLVAKKQISQHTA